MNLLEDAEELGLGYCTERGLNKSQLGGSMDVTAWRPSPVQEGLADGDGERKRSDTRGSGSWQGEETRL